MKNVEVYLAILAFYLFFKILFIALDDVAQWFEHRPVNQRVAGSILSQGICLGCGPGPQLGAYDRQPHSFPL